METSTLQSGDPITCAVRGQSFRATYIGPTSNGWFEVEPVSSRATWRRVRAHQIVRKVDRQERLEVAS
ncbi:MAG TPA: hypothetical protein VMS11_01845 [Solirubrobacterales bacterium]|nr:hypothetical protein [Solirubrobacterales bacterium]